MALTARAATASDYEVFASLFPELGVADPLPTAEEFAVSMQSSVVVVFEDGVAAGYAFYRVYGRSAHVVHLVVAPSHRGRRVGEALLGEVKERIKTAACTDWSLNVKRDNTSALRLYDRVGFRAGGAAWAIRLPWSLADALPASSARVRVPTVANDEGLSVRFGVKRERLAMVRGRDSTALIGLERDGDFVAFAAFDRAYPGAHPFRVASADLTGSLLAAMRPLADHDRFDFVHVTLEDDADVAELLIQAGAVLLHEITRMSAPL